MVRATGKEVIFISDGCLDAYVDDVIVCGARVILTEPIPISGRLPQTS